ncbi:hypothetical protein KC19_12G098000 [Ceratodon purpureus]|uniref:Uncharacterized protein n=1 Tax=Ceratodon purpureus TaxID=3225 RepID=A0A8T0G943_CERPU|nr:hypothetical protein KC19_12G098000 [Ceratodon purpureus]
MHRERGGRGVAGVVAGVVLDFLVRGVRGGGGVGAGAATTTGRKGVGFGFGFGVCDSCRRG